MPAIKILDSRPPGSPCVIRELGAQEWSRAVDWSAWYLTDEEDMGQSLTQGEVILRLKSSADVLVKQRGWTDAFVGIDNFFAWVQDHPLVRVSPDIYLLRGEVPKPPLPDSWQLWKPGHRAPEIAFEIVSRNWKKDYEENPKKYAQLGVKELVVFDPKARPRSKQRLPLQLFRRTEDGAFVSVGRSKDSLWSEVLQIWLVVKNTPSSHLRLSLDAAGKCIIPTESEACEQAEQQRKAAVQKCEAAEQQREAAEQQREAVEQQRAQEQQAKLEAQALLQASQAELARLRQELNRLRDG